MACITIDLDKYEFRDGPALRGYDSDSNGLLADFLPIDAEIIDYGVTEDEFEETSTTSKELPLPATTPSISADTQTEALVNSIHSSSTTKCVFVKVVDCEKYPGYYRKYQSQILKRKYFDTVELAKNIVKCLKNDKSKQPVVIDVDDLSDGSENFESNMINDSTVTTIAQNRSLILGKPACIVNKYTKLDQKKNSANSEIIRLEEINNESKTSKISVNIKKNKGLVGMKVQRISKNDRSKENLEEPKKNRKKKEKGRKQRDTHSSECNVKTVDKISENVCYSVAERKLMNTSLAKKKNRSKTDDEYTQKPDNGTLKENFGLECSLKISSPKILMKIKKITRSEENERFHHENISKDHQQFSKYDCKKVTKYKPIPKSKRIALEKNYNVDTKQVKPKDIKGQPNKKIELKKISTITTNPCQITTVNECNTNNDKMSATKLTQNNNETLKKTFLNTKKVLNVVIITPKISDEISKEEYKNEFIKKNLGGEKETLQLAKISNTIGPIQSVIMQNTNPGNKHDVPLRNDELSTKQGLSPVTKQISSNVDEVHKKKKCSDHRVSSLTNQNMNNYIFPSIAQSKENNCEKNALSANKFDNMEDIIKTNKNNKPKTKSIISSLRNPSDSHNVTKTNANQAQPSVSLPQERKSKPRNADNCSMPSPNEYILRNSSHIQKVYTSNTVVYKSHIPQYSQNQSQVLMRPPLLPPDFTMRPNIRQSKHIIRPHYGSPRFQRLPPLSPGTRQRLSAPYLQPHGQVPYGLRPQIPLYQVRHWRHNPYQSPNYAYLQARENIQRMPRSNINQYAGIRYVQNNYTQQPVYNDFTMQNKPHNAHMPPGISDVQPNNVHWPYNQNCLTFGPPRSPFQNPLVPVNSNVNDEVGSKKVVLNPKNTNIHSKTPTHTETVNIPSTKTHRSADETTPIPTKTEMMKELEKATTIVKNTTKSNSKRSYPNESCKEQANGKQISEPAPLTKKTKISNEFVTQPRNTKQIPKTGYSPAILPIPTFQNILSEVQTCVGIQFETPVSHPNTLKFYNIGTLGDNTPKDIAKNTPQRKTSNKIVKTKEKRYPKKISLAEYKQRIL